MRVLLCQTPRLTYVQAIELLQRETLTGPVDMALFPEMAIEHPPQCTGQGELTFENVAMLMLSRFCKQRRMYLVLGSVEERVDGCVYDTCVVLNKDGEFAFMYRKQSCAHLGKAAGNRPGVFDTEYGPIGILLGAEVEEENRWADILAKRPYLILNPARSPMQLDAVLIHNHPELQVSAWHKSLRRLEHIVETKTRSYACSFVRADAPFHEGGAGTSILVEPHRSVLIPRWGPAFCVVDTLHPYELEGRKLPGWRQLSVDERARLATRDRALLTQEEIERGPRYLVWTFRPGGKGGMKMPGLNHHWNSNAAQVDGLEVSDCLVTMSKSFLLPLVGKDNMQMYASITSKGQLLLWDVKMKRELSSSMLGASGLTAVSGWRYPNQMIVASSSKGITTLKIFEEHTPVGQIRLDNTCKVTKLRRSSFGQTRDDHDSPRRTSKKSFIDGKTPRSVTGAPLSLHVIAVFHVRNAQAIVLLEPVDRDHGPTAKLVDMEDGLVQDVDVYGSGPPVYNDDSDGEDGPLMSAPVIHMGQLEAPKVDKLIQARIVEQQIKGRMQKMLLCLYDSNRLVQCTLHDNELHEVMLVEDLAGERQRSDSPICFAVLPNSLSNDDAYHLVASYQSLMVRWWQVSLTTGKLHSQVTLNAAVTTLTMFDWPSTAGQTASISLPVEKPAGSPTSPKRANTRFAAAVPKNHDQGSVATTRQSVVRVVADEPEHARASIAAHVPLAGLHGGLSGFIKQRASIKGRASQISPGFKQTQALGAAATVHTHDDYMVNKDQSCLCVIAFDTSGTMPIFIARGGRITRMYTSSDHFVDKCAKVDQLVCDGNTIAVQISSGDIRHIEFVFEEELISIKSVPLDVAAA